MFKLPALQKKKRSKHIFSFFGGTSCFPWIRIHRPALESDLQRGVPVPTEIKKYWKDRKHNYFVDFPFLTKRLLQISFNVGGLGCNLPKKQTSSTRFSRSKTFSYFFMDMQLGKSHDKLNQHMCWQKKYLQLVRNVNLFVYRYVAHPMNLAHLT